MNVYETTPFNQNFQEFCDHQMAFTYNINQLTITKVYLYNI